MIRIDLGKGSDEKSSSKKSSFLGGKFSKQLSGLPSDAGSIVFLVAALAFAFLPYLFVDQFKESIRDKQKKDLSALSDSEQIITQDIEKYKSYKAELENFEKQSELVRQRISAVNELLTARTGPVNLLDAIGQSVPAHAWLTSLELTAYPEPSLSLSGSSWTNDEVSDFSDRLSASIYLEKVSLEEINSVKGQASEETKSFLIKAVPKGFKKSSAEERKTASASTGEEAQKIK